MSTAFHPQTDGQTERMNRILEDYLRRYVCDSQEKWVELLPVAEFAINNSVHESTKVTPFYLNKGFHPRTPMNATEGLDHDTISVTEGSAPAAAAFADRMANVLKDAKQHLRAAQDRQKAYADKSRRDLEFEVGQRVLLSSKNLMNRVRGSRKLLPRWLGPFTVLARIGQVAYRLDLPKTMQCHDVFHISLLRAYRDSGRVQPPPVPEFVDGHLEFEVERIVDHRVVRSGRRSRVEYLVRWLGYSSDYDSWEPQSSMSNCQELVAAYEDSALRVQRLHQNSKK
jgi:hypothetical protein